MTEKHVRPVAPAGSPGWVPVLESGFEMVNDFEPTQFSPEPGYEVATILVTARSYPTPSDKYAETVCTGGIRLDTPEPKLVRLHPVPYRLLPYRRRFYSYQFIRVPIAHILPDQDPRPESYWPDTTQPVQGVRLNRSVTGLRNRHHFLAPLLGATTMCALVAANRNVPHDQSAPSMGLIRALDVRVSIDDGQWFMPHQRRIIAKWQATMSAQGITPLEAPPYDIHLDYRCEFPQCPGHRHKLTAWGINMMMLDEFKKAKQNGRAPKVAVQTMVKRQLKPLVGRGNDPYFYVGNLFQDHEQFVVGGIWNQAAVSRQPGTPVIPTAPAS